MNPTHQQILSLISQHTAAHGFAPSQIELQKAMGFKAVRAVQYHLERMEELGLISREKGKARTPHKEAEKPPGMRVVAAGCESSMETAMRFIRWADALRRVPTADEVSDKFQVHKATAYRWLAAYRNAKPAAPAEANAETEEGR